MRRLLKFLRLHKLVPLIGLMSCVGISLGVACTLRHSNNEGLSSSLSNEWSQEDPVDPQKTIEQCLIEASETDGVSPTTKYANQIACYEKFDPDNPAKTDLLNELDKIETNESDDRTVSSATPKKSVIQDVVLEPTPINNDATKITDLEQERRMKCEAYKQQYGDKTPEELAREDPEVVNMLHDLAAAIARTNCCPEPDWMIPEEEMLKLQDQCAKATAHFKEVEAVSKALMKDRINYYSQLGSVCD